MEQINMDKSIIRLILWVLVITNIGSILIDDLYLINSRCAEYSLLNITLITIEFIAVIVAACKIHYIIK